MLQETDQAAATGRGPSRLRSGSIAVVTGAGQGIGRAIALRLAEEGATVAVCDLHADKADAVAAELNASGARAIGVVGDVTDGETVKAAFATVLDAYGTIDILVNNVGGGGSPPVLLKDLEEKHWDGSLDSNLKSAFLCSRTAANILIEQGKSGRIVSIASVNGKAGTPLLGAYSIAKAGVVRLTEVLARELASHRITVNCVCPGVVDTAITKKILARFPDIFIQAYGLTVRSPDETVRQALERHIPLGRLARPEDIAAAVTFLVSTDSEYITGQALNVCGGMISH